MYIETLEGPKAEAQLLEWTAACACPQGAVVRLANRETPNAVDAEVLRKVKARHLTKAIELAFAQTALAECQDFLGSIRNVTDNGGAYKRFHAVRIGLDEASQSPHLQSEYFLALALYFGMRNGPFGGEKTYAVPSGTHGLHDLASETQLFFQDRDNLMGAVALNYADNNELVSRTFYDGQHPVAQAAREVAESLMGDPSAIEWRLPHVRPLSQIGTQLGISPQKRLLEYPAAGMFQDLLPPHLADLDREARVRRK